MQKMKDGRKLNKLYPFSYFANINSSNMFPCCLPYCSLSISSFPNFASFGNPECFFASILDVEGNIFSLDGEQRLSYFNAYEFQVSLLYQLKQHNILVSVGVCFAKFLPPPTSPLTPADKNIRIVGTSFQNALCSWK